MPACLPAAFSNVCHVSIVAASYSCNVTIVSILCDDETSAAAEERENREQRTDSTERTKERAKKPLSEIAVRRVASSFVLFHLLSSAHSVVRGIWACCCC